MLPKSLSRFLLCVVCALSLFNFGCMGQRPDPTYLISPEKPALQACCAVITDFYIMCTNISDATEIRLNNCKVALYLEGVYRDLGPEKYYEAIEKLTKEERKQYRRYLRHEISLNKVIKKLGKFAKKALVAFPIMKDEVAKDPIGTAMYALSIARVGEQFIYAVAALDEFREYDALYNAALDYKGR